jgi:tRNA pseudouridine38-40 synthase
MLWGKGLDIVKIKDAASIFPGAHDFKNFVNVEKGKSTICDVRSVSVREQDGWIYIDIAANRFLWHMVRKIATALKLIGKGERDKEWLGKMLDTTLSESLSPLDSHGLILKDVRYPDVKWNIDAYARNRALEELHELFISYEITAKMLEEIQSGMQ